MSVSRYVSITVPETEFKKQMKAPKYHSMLNINYEFGDVSPLHPFIARCQIADY